MTKQAPTTNIKAPRSISLKVAAPWIIIIIGISLTVGLITGWNMRSSQVQEVRAQVSAQLEQVAVKK